MKVRNLGGSVQAQIARGNKISPSVTANKGQARVHGSPRSLLGQTLNTDGQVLGNALQVIHQKHSSSLDNLFFHREERIRTLGKKKGMRDLKITSGLIVFRLAVKSGPAYSKSKTPEFPLFVSWVWNFMVKFGSKFWWILPDMFPAVSISAWRNPFEEEGGRQKERKEGKEVRSKK